MEPTPKEACVATVDRADLGLFVPLSALFLLLLCAALTAHYLLIRREARLLDMHIRGTRTAPPSPADSSTSEEKASSVGDPLTVKLAHLSTPTTAPTKASDATAAPQRNEETGEVFPSAEAYASAMALAQRVRDLGLYLGDIMVSGISLGLPNAESGLPVFAPGNIDALMQGKNLIGKLPPEAIQAQLDRRVVQVIKGAGGVRERRPLTAAHEVIQLASRVARFDLAREFDVSPAVAETLDTTYSLAVAAGLQALRDAGLVHPPASSPLVAAEGAPAGWELASHHRDETGVIFAASFPALDSLVEELSRSMTSGLRKAEAGSRLRFIAELRGYAARDQAEGGGGSALPAGLAEWLDEQVGSGEEAAAAAAASYEFNRKLLFKLLVMANAQLAELVKARGPNLHINAACAGTTAAIALAQDWMRAGRCRRVVVISADNPSSEHLMGWVGIGFLALGAASIKPEVAEAALPFDKRRNGMLLGAGAVGMVLELETICIERPARPLAMLLGARHNNSAYHASAIGTKHACRELELLLQDVERVHGLGRQELADSLLYVSHETFTCARNGGCAGAEMTSLSAAFGEGLRKILITNTKGMTGHAMGVCFEDVLAVAALSTGRVPPVVNHCQADPLLGSLRLSTGGAHDCKWGPPPPPSPSHAAPYLAEPLSAAPLPSRPCPSPPDPPPCKPPSCHPPPLPAPSPVPNLVTSPLNTALSAPVHSAASSHITASAPTTAQVCSAFCGWLRFPSYLRALQEKLILVF